jgi:hypothetical protein
MGREAPYFAKARVAPPAIEGVTRLEIGVRHGRAHILGRRDGPRDLTIAGLSALPSATAVTIPGKWTVAPPAPTRPPRRPIP